MPKLVQEKGKKKTIATSKKAAGFSDIVLKELTASQKKAVTHKGGPLLIIAGAGTGKTTVITKRVAWLIAEGLAQPDEILSLTFTDKSAAEMEERVDRLLPLGYVDLWISTFHAFGEKLLREHALELGLDPEFKILSAAQQWVLLRENLFKFDLEYYRPLGNPTKFLYALTSHFSRAKDEYVMPEDYAKFAKDFEKKTKLQIKKAKSNDEREVLEEEIVKTNEIAAAYKTYQEILTEHGYMDFGDLIVNTLDLLKKRKGVLQKYRQQFKYILVDEFQDTNHAQYELVKLLATPKNNLTVVGDDDQSIYKFRGAAISNILAFKEDFPNAAEVVLTENFRSGQPILDLAYDVIQLNNPERLEQKLNIDKKLKAQHKHKAKPVLLKFDTLEKEVAGTISKIVDIKKKEKGATWDDFAILVRANAHAEPFLKALEQKEIPFEFVASKGLYSKPEVMDLVAFLRVIDNGGNSVALFRLMTSPMFNFSMSDVVLLLNYSRQKNLPLLQVFGKINGFVGLKKESIESATKLNELLTEGRELARRKSVGQVLYRFLVGTDHVKNLLSKADPESTKKVMNINQFFKQLQTFEQEHDDATVRAYIEQLELLQQAGEDPAPAKLEEGPESVKVMTVHSAKGLEFDHVFIVNLVDQRFPSTRRSEPIPLPDALIKEELPDKDAHLNEERRLFYVGLTRAKKGLYLVAAEDYGGVRKRKLSTFVTEVADQLSIEEKKTSEKLFGEEEVRESVPSKTTATLALPDRFSFTQLAAFKTCPRQYQYAHVLKIPVLGSHTFSYGKSLHLSLAEFYKQIQRDKKPDLDTLLDLYHRYWISDWYSSKAHELKQKKQGENTLRAFYEKNAPTFKAPKFIEKNFNLKLGGFTIRGAIDRVDVTEDGKVELIDYKSGRLKTQKEVDKDEQLSLYALALKKVFNLNVDKLALYFLDEGEKVVTGRSEEDLEKVEESIIEEINNIVSSDFSPTPGFLCKTCDFLSVCEEGQREVGRSQ